MKVTIKLNSQNDIKEFVELARKMDCDVLATSGKYSVDAKSILGIYSLDISKLINVELIERDYQQKDAFLHGLHELGILVD